MCVEHPSLTPLAQSYAIGLGPQARLPPLMLKDIYRSGAPICNLQLCVLHMMAFPVSAGILEPQVHSTSLRSVWMLIC